jgi:hypothetical protein
MRFVLLRICLRGYFFPFPEFLRFLKADLVSCELYFSFLKNKNSSRIYYQVLKDLPMIRFILKFTAVSVLVYLGVASFYFNLVTKDYYMGSQPLFSPFLISPNDTLSWEEAMVWMLPTQILRGLLIGFTFSLIREYLEMKNYAQKMLIIFSFYFLLSGLASVSPAVGNLEGMLFFKNYITWNVHLTILSEIFFQSIFISLIFSWWINLNLDQST